MDLVQNLDLTRVCSFLFVPPKSKEPKEKARRLKLSGPRLRPAYAKLPPTQLLRRTGRRASRASAGPRCASRCWRACLNLGFCQSLKQAQTSFFRHQLRCSLIVLNATTGVSTGCSTSFLSYLDRLLFLFFCPLELVLREAEGNTKQYLPQVFVPLVGKVIW